jgi:hypothetical protein
MSSMVVLVVSSATLSARLGVKYDLGQLRKGATVVVTLGNQANDLLMDSSN